MSDFFAKEILRKWGYNSATEAFVRIGNVWDLRYKEKRFFSEQLQKNYGTALLEGRAVGNIS